MKKIYLFVIAAALSVSSFAQTHLQAKGSNEAISPASISEQHNPGGPVLPTVQYFNDIIIENNAAINQRHVRLSVAFNGWLYAAYNTVDTITGAGGIIIRMSRDNGQSWTTIDSYSVVGVLYPSFDIVVAGNDTNAMTLYLAGINNSGANYTLYVDKYNATTGVFTGSNFNMPTATRPVYDVSLATDYRFPANGASPYSVGLLYSTYSSTYDSIVFLGSADGGSTWGIRNAVAVTGNYFRKVSLAYGRSTSASNGRYFGTWEMIGSSTARTGHIYTSRCSSTISGSWITPVNLDSTSSTMINLCSNPQMAVQYNNVDNDSASCTAVVLVQRDYNGDGSDYDLLGFYNKRSHYSNFWYRLDVNNSSENDLQPDVTYDPGANNFLATYYDSTNSHLPYVVANMNLTTPNAWTSITTQYNDQTTNLAAAWPRVEINPTVNQAAHAWIAEGPGVTGVAMFDAEYLVAGIPTHTHGGLSINPYPNPASASVNIAFSLENEANVTLEIYTISGQLVSTRNLGDVNAGTYNESFNVSEWNNGVYFVRINNGENVVTKNIVVAH